MNGASAAFAAIEQDIGMTSCSAVLESYRKQVAAMIERIECQLANTRGDLLAQEETLEHGRALMLRIEQRTSEESATTAVNHLHPIFENLLSPYIAQLRKAA